MKYIVGRAEDLFREELLEKAKDQHGLLVCVLCGWSWLTLETAKVDWSVDGVCCLDLADCIRRGGMRMKVFVPSKKSAPGKFYESSTGRRATPLCSYDSITSTGIVRGENCYCHLPAKVN